MRLAEPQPLASHHRIEGFDSGTPSLDQWLKQRARKNQVMGASRTFVVCDSNVVVGFYCLSTSGLVHGRATGKLRRNMPDPIPVVVMGRLAIDARYQGKGLGRALIVDAIRRVVHAADSVGIAGVVVHALDGQAKAFYERIGFIASAHEPLTLMASLPFLKDLLP
jgi:predicted N-acetyltransferase YhbS